MELEVFIDGLRNMGALFVAELLLLLPSVQRRDNFAVRIIVSVLVMLFLSFLFVVFYFFLFDFTLAISALWYFLVAVFTTLLISGCFKPTATDVLWSMITAYAVQHIVYAISYELIFPGTTFGDDEYWIAFGVYMAFFVVLYAVLYLYLRRIKGLVFFEFSKKDEYRYSVLFSILFIVFIGATFINQLNVAFSESYKVLCGVADLITCAFVVVLQFAILYAYRISAEKKLSDSLLETEKKQYLAYKNSVDYINVKVHDLKQEIGDLNAREALSPERLQELTDNIAIYEAFAKTGNETLDIVLTEKNLLCLSDDITFTYLADAEKLSALRDDEIHSLFGNLLDNAIECERKVEDKEKRFIRLFIKPSGSFVMVHCENYFEGELDFANGVPVTTKADKSNHGLGIVSMQRTVKNHDGKLSMSVEDNLFKAEILLNI